MIKVFLVEDEAIIRRGIRNNIPWEKEGFQFVGEASDGELAYPMIKKAKPDIVITDIKMPFMDGLELASIIRKEMPDTKIIILSGYNEFEYAKTAISIGVTDYQLKPISSEKLLETIKRVADIIREEQAQKMLLEEYKKDNQEGMELEKAKLFYALADNSLSTAEILEWGRQLGLDLTASYYTVILLKIISSAEENTYQEQVVEAERKSEAFLKEQECIYYFKRWGEGWFLLVRSEDEEEFSELLQGLKEYFAQLIPDESDGLCYFGGIGHTVQRLGDVRQSFLSANRAFTARFFADLNQIITEDELKRHEAKKQGADDLKDINISNIDRRLLEDFLKMGDIEEAPVFLDAYFDKIGVGSYSSLMFRQYLMVDMYFCVSKFLEDLGGSSQKFMEKFGDVEEIKMRIHSTDRVREYMQEIFTEALEMRDSLSRDKYSRLLKDAQYYAEQNYTNNEISLNMVASHVGISPSYFSTIFRQETGSTFIEYLTGLRMEKAKELLRCTNKKTAEIAYDVGYKDSHYFSYIFKKTQGLTPKEYRGERRESGVQ